ncbi:hypothetical protein BLOT_002272 [Blomia tropicalis]|nr:hypothetical protein BLOT_002272 [Blomia tropicalis]
MKVFYHFIVVILVTLSIALAQDEDNVNTNTVTDAPATDTTENETKPKDKSDDNENNNQKPQCPGVFRIYGIHRIDPFGYGRRPMPGPRYEFDYPPYYIRRHWPSLYPGSLFIMDQKLVEDHDPSITATTSGEQNRTNQNNRISDRFVAKVVNVFERCADVILFWSPKRDIRDLKIKAYLRLVDSKRYSNGGRNRNSNRSNNFSVRNIEVSELIYVELDYISSDRKNIEVIRCKTLSPEADQTVDDNDVDELDEDRFKSKSLERTTFHDYMMDHDNLRNPYLTKQPPFTSLLYGSQFVDCYRRKLEQRKLTKRKSNESTNVKDDELVILNDTGKSSNQKAESRNEPFSDRSRRPTFSISSERTPNLKKNTRKNNEVENKRR